MYSSTTVEGTRKWQNDIRPCPLVGSNRFSWDLRTFYKPLVFEPHKARHSNRTFAHDVIQFSSKCILGWEGIMDLAKCLRWLHKISTLLQLPLQLKSIQTLLKPCTVCATLIATLWPALTKLNEISWRTRVQEPLTYRSTIKKSPPGNPTWRPPGIDFTSLECWPRPPTEKREIDT